MPYSKHPKPEDYFENYQTIKPFSYWQRQQAEYLKEMLGVELYQWITKEASESN